MSLRGCVGLTSLQASLTTPTLGGTRSRDDDKSMPPATTSATALTVPPRPPPIGGLSSLSWHVEHLLWTLVKPNAMREEGVVAGGAELIDPVWAVAVAQAYEYYAKQVCNPACVCVCACACACASASVLWSRGGTREVWERMPLSAPR